MKKITTKNEMIITIFVTLERLIGSFSAATSNALGAAAFAAVVLEGGSLTVFAFATVVFDAVAFGVDAFCEDTISAKELCADVFCAGTVAVIEEEPVAAGGLAERGGD